MDQTTFEYIANRKNEHFFNFIFFNIFKEPNHSVFVTTTKPTKKVRFASNVSASDPTIHLTRDELKALWYDAQTISGFKNRIRKIILSGRDITDPKYNDGTPRGLG